MTTAAERPGASLADRISDTFTAPRALAATLREHPRWIDVLLISTAVAVLAAAFLPPEIFLEASREAVTRRGAPVEITSPPGEVVRWGRYLAMLSAILGHPLIAFGLAGLLTLVFTILPGGRATFVEHLALTSHALLVLALGTVVGVAAQRLTGNPDAYPSLAMLVPFLHPESGLRRTLELVSPFTVWMLIVLAIGVDALDPRRSLAAALALLLGGYLALAVGLSAWTA